MAPSVPTASGFSNNWFIWSWYWLTPAWLQLGILWTIWRKLATEELFYSPPCDTKISWVNPWWCDLHPREEWRGYCKHWMVQDKTTKLVNQNVGSWIFTEYLFISLSLYLAPPKLNLSLLWNSAQGLNKKCIFMPPISQLWPLPGILVIMDPSVNVIWEYFLADTHWQP